MRAGSAVAVVVVAVLACPLASSVSGCVPAAGLRGCSVPVVARLAQAAPSTWVIGVQVKGHELPAV